MPKLTLVEYHNIGEKTYSASGNSLVFDPAPRSVKKDVAVKWRIRRPGYEKKLERARYRYNEKIGLTIVGACKGEKRDELEWFAKRDSLYKIGQGAGDGELTMVTYHSEQTDDVSEGTPATWAAAKAQGPETFYAVFDSITFTQLEARIDWYQYTIKMKRVHLTRH